METKTPPPAKIMDRIRKCMNLGDVNKGATEEEAATAMLMAKKLMREHNLSMSDVALKAEAEAGANGVADKRWRKTEDVWETYLARAIDSLFGTKHYTTTRWEPELKKNMRRVMFVGVGEDANVAAESFAILVDTVHSLGYKMGYKGRQRTSYCLGVVHTLCERAKDQVKEDKPEQAASNENRERGIMVIKNAVIDQHMKSLGLRNARRSGLSINGDAYNQGKADGRNVDMGFRRALK